MPFIPRYLPHTYPILQTSYNLRGSYLIMMSALENKQLYTASRSLDLIKMYSPCPSNFKIVLAPHIIPISVTSKSVVNDLRQDNRTAANKASKQLTSNPRAERGQPIIHRYLHTFILIIIYRHVTKVTNIKTPSWGNRIESCLMQLTPTAISMTVA